MPRTEISGGSCVQNHVSLVQAGDRLADHVVRGDSRARRAGGQIRCGAGARCVEASDVEDLIARIADLKDADVVRVRGKVERAVDATKQSLADSADLIRQHAQNAANTADNYIRESPWQAVGIAALVGAIVGILATRRS